MALMYVCGSAHAREKFAGTQAMDIVNYMSFGDLLRAALAERGLSTRTAQPLLQLSYPMISQVCTGRRLPPLDRIEAWADALKITGDDRSDFLRAAYLAHAPEQVRHLVADLETRIAALADRLTAIERHRAADAPADPPDLAVPPTRTRGAR
jgi:transcriptional regulator with XRE-family HTH domain